MSGGDPVSQVAHGAQPSTPAVTASVRQVTPRAGESPGAFWEGVVSGQVKLSAVEDQMVWDLRAAHWRWDFIAAAILRRRRDYRLRVAAMDAGRARDNARRWRDLIRAERKGMQ
jgi:hypothetical protein